MFRQLPARPDLEHLRNQAKELLQELQRRDPGAQLADAQHTLAREYGFPSWPKLKVHVQLQANARTDERSPFVGRWQANLAMSKRHPANAFRSATIVFAVRDETVRISDVVVDGLGREERHDNTIRADGREHASDSGRGYSWLARWRNSHTLETVGKKDGQVVGAATY